MLLKLLGWLWIITGIFWLWRPEWLRNRLKKKSYKQLRRVFFILALILSMLLIKAGWGIPSVLAKIIVLLGILGIIKAFFFLKAKAADVVFEWFLKQPVRMFRVWATVQIAFGALLLSV